MGLAKLMKATIVLPRMETQEAVSRLAALEWFHPIQNTASEHINPYYDDLLTKAQRLYQDIDEVVKALGIPPETGVLATMFKGAPKGKHDYAAENIQGFIADLEEKSAKLLEGPRKVLEERNRVQRELEEYSNLEALVSNAANLSLNLAAFGKLVNFFANLFVIDAKDEAEIRKSLDDLAIFSTKLNENKTSLVIIGSAEDSERVLKVLRSFGVNPLQIPADMPQNPSEAYAIAKAKVKELEAKAEQMDKEVEKVKQSILTQLLSLQEAARVAKDVLEITRKPGGTKNFAVIEGYIPQEMEDRFKKLTSDYVSIIEDANLTVNSHEGEHSSEPLPSLLTNKKYMHNFQVITETQGLPRYGEVDPTPIIAFVWPIFYGLMFADFGHGLLLFGLGMLFRYRGNGRLKVWGTLIAASGLAATVGGLGTGEMFGFHFDHISFLEPLAHALPVVGLLSVSELTFEEVVKILEVSIAVGIIHLLMAFFLRLRANLKQGNKIMVYTHDVPAIIQYLAVVSLILAAIGSQYDIIGMFLSDNYYETPVPWLTFVFGSWVSVGLVAKAMPPVIIACIVITILGGMKEQKHALAHGKEPEGGGLVGIVVETVMVRTIEMLANTISYSRLGIMLLVHTALLVTVINSYEHGGGLAILIGGNIGIMMIEGLIVYIQTIRLHLYEWFPKWYKSDGVQFKKLVPQMLYTNLVWKYDDGKKKVSA
ncbi:archaeal A1A0-type ATP synthase, subunit I [Candidatus Nitrososphaera gargensis Ga9.2]|uniref:A-type ATP synthase subunit I n=1 Tax=Nitrososphaera gargensis (strain Ga9.2) TaxID=1237085 RepID=K0IJB3_NITGG|nr:V-type ATPase 116kDa subunit family protein [Candidatus Nitrososphaera gargensis]AFU60110.1 archaeal A1A0-type ATP synthase, subunit I [Candidatus Nitrososphaera gargensis Ga9.2]